METRTNVSRRRLIVLLGVLACAWPGAAAAGKNAKVSLGELNARGASGNLALTRLFESSVERELSQLDLSGARSHDSFVLSATLLKVGSRKDADRAQARAVVSATLRRARGGELHAIVRGTARATDASTSSKDAERAAVRAAVKSALRRVPEALR